MKVIEERQKLSILKVKINTLELEIENSENELQNKLLKCNLKLLIRNLEIHALYKEKIDYDCEATKLESNIAQKKRRMSKLKSDLKNIEKHLTANFKVNVISYAIVLFFSLVIGFMYYVFFEPSSFELLLFYYFNF